ncbi:MAG: helix-turn-helix transcriptional regulator [Actinobacteria bacterium]|nr:helix-turn-helix transcriptional regulator [Actinomycetota bacterium]
MDPDSSPLALFGARLRGWRLRRGWSQAQLGRLVHVSGDLIAKVEKAERRPLPDLVERLEEALRAEGELRHLAGALHADDRDRVSGVPLEMVISGEPAGEAVGEAGRQAVAGVREVLGGLRRLDHSLGSGAVLGSVLAQVRVVESLLPGVRGALRVDVLRLLAELHQLVGWMRFDQGELRAADVSLESARGFAEASGDPALVAFILGASHGFTAIYTGRAALGLRRCGIAVEWARRSGNRRLTAFTLTIGARAWAKLGEPVECQRMLEEADAVLSRHDPDGPDPAWLAVFDGAALQGHRGSCLLDLGRPGDAIDPLSEQDARAPGVFVRNRAIWLLDRAAAHVELEQVEAACTDVRAAWDAAAGTSSLRIMRRLRAGVANLGRWGQEPQVVELTHRWRTTPTAR